MTAPKQHDPDAVLDSLLAAVDDLQAQPPDQRGAAAEALVAGFVELTQTLAAGGTALPQQWAGATPAAPQLPASDADTEVEAARVAMEDASRAYDAAVTAELVAHNARDASARVLGEARKKFYDLARLRDLSRR